MVEFTRGRSARGVLTLFDQALSSATNFLVSIVALRSLSLEEFGAVAVALLIYGFSVKVSRALSSEPLVIRYVGAEVLEHRAAIASSAVASFIVGGTVGISIIVATPFLSTHLSSTLSVLALGLPFLLLQDSYRYSFFSIGRPELASALDFCWLVFNIAGLSLVLAAGFRTPAMILLAWTLAGAVAAALGVALSPNLSTPKAALRWMRSLGHLSIPILTETVVGVGSRQIVLYTIAAIAGLGSLGAFQGARTIFGPVNIALLGFSAFVLPEVARVRSRPTAVRRLVGGTSLILVLVVAVLTATLILGDDALWSAVFGPNWTSVKPFIVPTALSTAAMAAIAMLRSGLRGIGSPVKSLGATGIMATARLVLGVAAAVVGGALAGAFGLATANLVGASRFGLVFRSETGTPGSERDLRSGKALP